MSLRCVVLVVVGRVCACDSLTGLQTSILSLQWSSFTARTPRRLSMINAGKSKWFNLVQLYCVCGNMAEGDWYVFK